MHHARQHASVPAATAVADAPESDTRLRPKVLGPLALAMRQARVSQRGLAVRMRCSRALVEKLSQGSLPLSLERVAAVCTASPRVGAALLGILRARLDVLEGASTIDASAAVPLLAAEGGDVARVWLRVAADGELSDEDLVALDAEWADVERVARAARRGIAARLARVA